MKKLIAFTLAEVLITLGIIGVVAALTIPTLLQNQQDQQKVAKLKKEYSVLSQAYTMAVQENGTPDTWITSTAMGDPTSGMNIFNNLAPYLKISKNCGFGTGCLPVPFAPLDDSDTSQGFVKFQLVDGTIVYLRSWGSVNLPDVGPIWVDVNGVNGPNQKGKDLFYFILSKDRIYPAGNPQQAPTEVNLTSCYSGGQGCTAWVIYKGNLDYLKCTGLSWNGPTTCQ